MHKQQIVACRDCRNIRIEWLPVNDADGSLGTFTLEKCPHCGVAGSEVVIVVPYNMTFGRFAAMEKSA